MEEISLRELIEIIWKGKWVIAVVTVVFVLVAAVLSFFVMESTYEAETMLMVTPITSEKNGTHDFESIEGIVSTLAKYPVMTLDTYKEQVKAPEVLQYVRAEAGLNDFTLARMKDLITVESVNNTNILKIKVSYNDPNIAARVANLTSERFTTFVSETSKKQAESSAKFIEAEMVKEKEGLDKATDKLKKFMAQPRGPEELHQELNSKMNQLTQFKTDLAQILIDKRVAEGKLNKAQELLEATPQYIVTEKSVLDDGVLSDLIQDETGQDTAELAGIRMQEENINPAFTELTQEVNNLNISVAEFDSKSKNFQTMIDVRQKEIEILQIEYAEKNRNFEELDREVSLIEQTYEAYQQKYKEATIKQTAELGKSSIVTVSEAIAPKNPVAPRKMMNMAIAGVLGLMISGFIVFFKAYWQSSGIEIQQQANTDISQNA